MIVNTKGGLATKKRHAFYGISMAFLDIIS